MIERYGIDATKIELDLVGELKRVFESGILKTIKWYLEKY